MDFRETPLVASLINNLQKIDKKNDIANYHSKVRQILHFSPTHQEALIAYLDWMNEHGEEKEMKEFVRNFLAQYPHSGYKDLFLKYLTDNKKKEDGFHDFSSKETEKEELLAVDRIK